MKYYNIERTEVVKFKEELMPLMTKLSELKGRNLYSVSDSCRKHLDVASAELIALLKAINITYLKSDEI